MRTERERKAIVASLEALESDPDVLDAVSKRLAERAAAAAKAKEEAAAQARAVRDALRAAGVDPATVRGLPAEA